MASVPCRQCKRPITPEAIRCPRCGATSAAQSVFGALSTSSSEVTAYQALLLAKYSEERAQARQHETLRASVTTYTTAIAGGILVFSAETSNSAESQLIAGGFVFLLGFVGALLSWKHYERFRYHSRWGSQYDLKLRNSEPDLTIQDYQELKADHEVMFGAIAGTRAYQLWIAPLIATAAMGTTLYGVTLHRSFHGNGFATSVFAIQCLILIILILEMMCTSHYLNAGKEGAKP